MAPNSADPPSPTLSQLPPVPVSPTYSYASTAANPLSQYNLPLPPPPQPAHAVLTKADLEHSQAAYADLLVSAKSYRVALAALSTAASAFGSALESCARLKEARAEPLLPAVASHRDHAGIPMSMSSSFLANKASNCTADALLTVAGLQHLVANHQHILSETIYRSFEVPLLHELDKWRGAVEDEEEGYARAIAAQSKEIRRLEKEGLKLHHQRRRDVSKFRSHLVELTTKLDGLTALHGDHARTLLRESQETSVRIVDASCSLVRAEVDIFESLARKGWTGGGLEDVLEKGVDLFASEEPVNIGSKGVTSADGRGVGGGSNGILSGGMDVGESSKLFSILPPNSILAVSTPERASHNRADSLLVEPDRYQSLTGAMSESTILPARDRDKAERDTDSVFSEFNRSRGVRPFSPQPQHLRLNPEALLGGAESRDSSPTAPVARRKISASSQQQQLSDAQEDEGIVEGCAMEDEEDDEEAHPWRNEGLNRKSDEDDDDEDEEEDRRVGASLNDLEGVRQREDGSWSMADGS